MKLTETIATMLVVLAIAGTTVGIFGYEQVLDSQRDCITIHMRTYEHGNPVPNTIYLKKGQPACLRLTSDDTTHGFNIPDLNLSSDPVHPGKWTYVRFTPQESGTYSFVCYLVCSPMHSRVRGKIVVED